MKDYCLVFWRGDYGRGESKTTEIFRVGIQETKLNDVEALEQLVKEAYEGQIKKIKREIREKN